LGGGRGRLVEGCSWNSLKYHFCLSLSFLFVLAELLLPK
jgi:hypothetical protein